MSQHRLRRQHVRVSLDRSYTLRFEMEGRVFRGVEMTNISVGGVGIKLSHGDAVRLSQGSRFHCIVFEHPELPKVKVEGEVRHMLGQNTNNAAGIVLVGVQYIAATENVPALLEDFITEIENFIDLHLGSEA